MLAGISNSSAKSIVLKRPTPSAVKLSLPSSLKVSSLKNMRTPSNLVLKREQKKLEAEAELAFSLMPEFNPLMVTIYESENPKIPNVRIGRPTNGGKVDIKLAYQSALAMQEAKPEIVQNIPPELLKPRKPLDNAYDLMRRKYDPPKQPHPDEIENTSPPPVRDSKKVIDLERFAQSFDLSWHQGPERVAKYKAIKRELQTLLDELPLKPNLHQLLEVIHKKYPKLHIKAISKEELIEKIFLVGLEKNTPLYTQKKKAYTSGDFALFAPGSFQQELQAVQDGTRTLTEKASPRTAQLLQSQAELNLHEVFNVDSAKPMMVVSKDGSFLEAFHEFIHYLQDREGLALSNYSTIPKALIPDRLTGKSKAAKAAMYGSLTPSLTYSERQVLKQEALAEAEVGQLIAQLLPGKVPEDSYARKQHPYTVTWMNALPDLEQIRPYAPEAIKVQSAFDIFWNDMRYS